MKIFHNDWLHDSVFLAFKFRWWLRLIGLDDVVTWVPSSKRDCQQWHRWGQAAGRESGYFGRRLVFVFAWLWSHDYFRTTFLQKVMTIVKIHHLGLIKGKWLYLHDPLPGKVSQLNAPLCLDAVSYQLNSPACPRFTHFRLWFVIQPKEVLLNERTILPGDRRYDMSG